MAKGNYHFGSDLSNNAFLSLISLQKHSLSGVMAKFTYSHLK